MIHSKRFVRLSAVAVLAAMAFTPFTQTAHAATDYTAQRDSALSYMHQELGNKQFKYVLDWPALALYAAGEAVTGAKWSTPQGQNGVTWRENDLLRMVNISDATTDFESTLLGVLAAQQNPRGFGKKDLVQAVIDSQQPSGKFADFIQGDGDEFLNAHIYGIISLHAAGVMIPSEAKALQYLLSKQHADGGFHWSNAETKSDPDVTAMALIAMKALGLQVEDSNVRKALDYLNSVQTDDGGFRNDGVVNADTTAIVIEALQMYGIDLSTWTKGGHSPVDFLLSLQNGDGSFSYQKGQSGTMMSTHSATLALSDLMQGSSVYARLHAENIARSGSWSPAFKDLPFSHPYYRENIKLANLGVFSGSTDGTFGPDNPVTREQFAKILVYGANIQSQAKSITSQFRDVPADSWANKFIALVAKNKFIYGTSDTTFEPAGEVSGGQLMAILVRMLGMEEEAQVNRGANWYDGYVTVAKEQGLWYPNFDPTKSVSRAEVGYSFVRLYEAQMKRAMAQAQG